MKTMKLVCIGLCLALTFACKKEEGISNCEKLVGVWSCTSSLLNGQELIGSSALIASSTLDYQLLTGDQGTYQWDINYTSGGSSFVIGSYVVNETCDMVTLTPKDGAPVPYTFHFEGEALVMETMVQGDLVELQFSK